VTKKELAQVYLLLAKADAKARGAMEPEVYQAMNELRSALEPSLEWDEVLIITKTR